MLRDLHELVLPDDFKNHPMKSLSTSCLGSTAAGVMVESTGLAIESCHKAEANNKSGNSRFDIFFTMSVTFQVKRGGRLKFCCGEEQAET